MDGRVSKEERERMRRLAEAAAEGPWSVYQLAPDNDPQERLIVTASHDEDDVCGIIYRPDDAEHIAYANPERVLRLLDDAEEAQRLRRAHENLWKACGNYFEACGEARSKESLDSYWQKMYEAWREAPAPDTERGFMG